MAKPILTQLMQPLLLAKLGVMSTDLVILQSLMNRTRSSVLTSQLNMISKQVHTRFAEVKRTLKAAQKSSIVAKSAAATLLMPVFKPFWDVTIKPMASRIAQFGILFARISDNPDFPIALTTLELDNIWLQLGAANMEFHQLYEQRLEEEAAAVAPAASDIQDTVVKDYKDLCTVIKQTLSVMPNPSLELLFNEMNELRRKYVPKHPDKLDPEHTTVEPLPVQSYTGKQVTPLPRVFYRTDTDAGRLELQFTIDYFVTYRNNIEAGEATITIHGKGRYTGQHVTSFHIAR
ncbi:MAG: DUF6261 family protein [Tannerella sp.]|nr:DUF6261 family protein [Tannerella sp.]